jgi:hypothetical protein
MQELAQQQAAARTAEAAGARSRGEGAGCSSRDAQSIVSIAAARRTIKPTALQVYACPAASVRVCFACPSIGTEAILSHEADSAAGVREPCCLSASVSVFVLLH